MKRIRTLFLPALMLLGSLSISAAEYQIDRSAENRVRFISEAPLEKIIGTTTHLDGYVLWDGDTPLQNSEFYFTVALKTLDTGIGLRNRHMRENYLETEKFPDAWFKGQLQEIEKKSDTLYVVTASGRFYVHGVEQPRLIRGEVRLQDGRLFLTAAFSLKLADHRITVPQLMFMKVGETLQIEISAQLKQISQSQEAR